RPARRHACLPVARRWPDVVVTGWTPARGADLRAERSGARDRRHRTPVLRADGIGALPAGRLAAHPRHTVERRRALARATALPGAGRARHTDRRPVALACARSGPPPPLRAL